MKRNFVAFIAIATIISASPNIDDGFPLSQPESVSLSITGNATSVMESTLTPETTGIRDEDDSLDKAITWAPTKSAPASEPSRVDKDSPDIEPTKVEHGIDIEWEATPSISNRPSPSADNLPGMEPNSNEGKGGNDQDGIEDGQKEGQRNTSTTPEAKSIPSIILSMAHSTTPNPSSDTPTKAEAPPKNNPEGELAFSTSSSAFSSAPTTPSLAPSVITPISSDTPGNINIPIPSPEPELTSPTTIPTTPSSTLSTVPSPDNPHPPTKPNPNTTPDHKTNSTPSPSPSLPTALTLLYTYPHPTLRCIPLSLPPNSTLRIHGLSTRHGSCTVYMFAADELGLCDAGDGRDGGRKVGGVRDGVVYAVDGDGDGGKGLGGLSVFCEG